MEVIGFFGQNKVGAEIGVWRGRFSEQILQYANPSKLYLIDPWVLQSDDAHKTALYGKERNNDMEAVYQGVVSRFSEAEKKGQVSIIRAFSAVALQSFANESLDFIYIDGDHSYESVRRDCFDAYDKVKIGGMICGDDYKLDGWWGRGIVDAFHELLQARATILRYVRENQIVIQKC